MAVIARRLHYVDWLRVLAVLLLFPFHTSRVFNEGEAFYVKSQSLSSALNTVLWFIDFWHMPLLFMLAGISTYFALRTRTAGQYLGERVTRLLVPLLFGWLVLIPPQTWYGARFNSGYSGSFVRYLTSGDFVAWNVREGGDFYGGFGLGHLWFIMYLLFIAILAPPLLLWWSKNGQNTGQRVARLLLSPAGWPVVGVLLMVAEGLPSPIDDKSFFYFMALFVLGYLAGLDGRLADTAERWHWPVLIAGVAILVFRMFAHDLHDGLADPSVGLAVFNTVTLTGVWLMLIGFLGIGRRYLDRPSRLLAYLAEGSYALYLLHQTVIVVLAYYLVRMPGLWMVQWTALLGAATAGTFAAYEVVRRTGALRFLFGMKRKKQHQTAAA